MLFYLILGYSNSIDDDINTIIQVKITIIILRWNSFYTTSFISDSFRFSNLSSFIRNLLIISFNLLPLLYFVDCDDSVSY